MEDFIPTRAAKMKKNAEILHVATTYKSHKKSVNLLKNRENKKENISDEYIKQHDSGVDSDVDREPIDERRKQELEMKRFRYDVIKFGMSGFEKHKARQAKVALAISLGAKPLKNRRKNYKKLIIERKQEKAREKKKEKFVSGFDVQQLSKNRKDKTKSQTKKKKESSQILEVYGKVTKNKVHKRKDGKTKGLKFK